MQNFKFYKSILTFCSRSQKLNLEQLSAKTLSSQKSQTIAPTFTNMGSFNPKSENEFNQVIKCKKYIELGFWGWILSPDFAAVNLKSYIIRIQCFLLCQDFSTYFSILKCILKWLKMVFGIFTLHSCQILSSN